MRDAKARRKAYQQHCTRQSGFSLIEVLLVSAIVGILANIAVPQVRSVLRKAQAASIVAEVTGAERAAWAFSNDYGRFPEETAAGSAPAGFSDYVGSGFPWRTGPGGVTYDWQNWATEDDTPLYPDTNVLYGISVLSDDIELLDTVDELYDGWTLRLWNSHLVFVVDGLTSGGGAASDDPGDDDDAGDGSDDDGGPGDSGNGNGNGNNGNGNGNNGNGNGNNGNGNGNNGNGNGNNGNNGNGNGNNGNGNGNNGNGNGNNGNGNGNNGNGNGNGNNGNGNGNNGNGGRGRG